MFYLMTHLTHFIYGYMPQACGKGPLRVREETHFYHMGYSLQLVRVLLMQDRISHITAFVTPVVEHWLEREIAQWVNHEGSIR